MSVLIDDLSDSPVFENPFSIHRAEHLGKDLYRYYAKARLFSRRLSAKSLVLMGGRGCGKTMFFIYHTYESKRREHEDPNTGKSSVLEAEHVLGVYVHAKSDIVTAFNLRNLSVEAWTRVFAHYFNVVVGQQIAKIAEDVKRGHKLDSNIEQGVCNDLSILLDVNPPILNYGQIASHLRRLELETVRYIGSPSRFEEPLLTVCGQIPKTLADGFASDPLLASKVVHVFVDEYENLLEYQQRIINTLIKTPSASFVVDIGLRKEGWKTRATLAESESISHPHDFNVFEFDVDLTPDEYRGVLRETCQKRLFNLGVSSSIPAFDPCSIESYLGEYEVEEEIRLLLKGKKTQTLPYKKDIKVILEKRVPRGDRSRLFQQLANGEDEIINRLNLCLLLQNKDPQVLSDELEKYGRNEPSKYKDWVHNYGMGVVFLLCRDLRVNKRYWGSTTFRLMSSGIIRYFLELCENAFNVAMRNGFTFETARPLTIAEQDAAAQAVSARKVEEVDSYTPYGMHLKKFVSVLGAVFESLHEDKKISEPERNHFSTRPEELSEDARKVLK